MKKIVLAVLTAASLLHSAEDMYVKDIAFLLDAFEQQAGGLMKVKGIGWKEVREDFSSRAKEVKSHEEHLALVHALIGALHDGHAGIVKSQVRPPDESKGHRYTGPRVHLAISGEKVLVRAAFKDAADAGIRAGQEVISMDGTPAREWLDQRIAMMEKRGSSFSTRHQALYAACHWGLADWEGTAIRFELRKPGGETFGVEKKRLGGPNHVPLGPVFPPSGLESIGRQSFGLTPEGFAYIHLRDVPENLPQQLDQMLVRVVKAPGLILDLRANGGGGCDHAAVMGRFLAKGQPWSYYEGTADVSFTGPMVVILDAGTRSAGETVAALFRETGRAYVIGDSPSAGMSSRKTEVEVPSGLFRVRFSVASNMTKSNAGRGIEGIGIHPHELVPLDSADLDQEKDTHILRAVTLLRNGFPEDTVDYTGPPK